jgi:hypothetical protein
MPAPLPAEQRAHVVALLHEGKSRNDIARIVGCCGATVTKIAAAEGVEFNRLYTEKASAATRDYALAERIALVNAGFAKAAELLPGLATASALASWSVAVATLIDKRRLEDGEATSRTDVIDDGARDRLARRMDELAARRDARRLAG